MVIRTKQQRRDRGMLVTDLIVGLGILALALIPISYSYLQEQRLCRAYYQRGIVTQILDGEMEVLAAGEWRRFNEGSQKYSVQGLATKNLPPGEFVFSRRENQLRLEWHSAKNEKGVTAAREAVGK